MTSKQPSIREIVEEYNTLAVKAGKNPVKTFKDRPTAVKRLEALKAESKEAPAPKTKEKIALAEIAADRPLPKCAAPRVVKRINKRMFRTIQKIKEPPSNLRRYRWGNYKDGMTLYEIAINEGTDVREVTWYVKQGLMKLIEPSDEFVQEQLKKYKAS